MPYNALQPITEGGGIDLEFLNQLAENDQYLKDIIPDVLINSYITGTEVNSEKGTQIKIQGGSTPLAAFTGTYNLSIPFLVAHTGAWNAVVVATVTGSVPTQIMVTGTASKNFSVRLVPSITGRISGMRLNWIAITQVAAN
jgi:hypothetical protein